MLIKVLLFDVIKKLPNRKKYLGSYIGYLISLKTNQHFYKNYLKKRIANFAFVKMIQLIIKLIIKSTKPISK